MFKRKNKFFQDFDYMTNEDIKDNKITYDKLVRVSPYLEKDKALSYSIILNRRDDLDEETKKQLQALIVKDVEQQKRRIDHYLQNMETKDYSVALERNPDKY